MRFVDDSWDMRSRNEYKLFGISVDIVQGVETARVTEIFPERSQK